MAEEPLLSKDEVGALLGGVDEGAIPAGEGIAARGEVREYEIGSSRNVSSYCPSALVGIFEKTAEEFGAGLKALVMRDVPVTVESLRRRRYDDYMAELANPTCLFPLEEPALPGTGLIALETRLVSLFLEQYYGGTGGGSDDAAAGVSALEKRLARLLAATLADLFNSESAKAGALAFSVGPIETDPRRLAVAAQSDHLLVARLRLVVAEGAGECHLVLPLPMLAPLGPQLDALGQGSLGQQRRFRMALRKQLARVGVDLTATFCQLPMSLRRLLTLCPGDVIPFRMPEDIPVRVAGSELIRGEYGQSRGQRAVRILQAIPDSPTPDTQQETLS